MIAGPPGKLGSISSLAAMLLAGAAISVFSFTGASQERETDQSPRIVAGRKLLVSTDAPLSPHAESFLALNPKDAAQLLATSIVFERGRSTSVIYASVDGGRTWRRSESFGTNVPPFAGSDPIVYYDGRGAAMFGSIAGMPDGFRLWRSTDKGLHWNSMVTVPGGLYDRQYLGIDQTSETYAGRLYTVGAVVIRGMDGLTHYALAVSFSSDNGSTFSPTVFIDPTSIGQQLLGVGDPLVTRRGKLIVPFETRPLALSAGMGNQLWTIISDDGGSTFSKPRPGPHVSIGSGFRALKTAFPRRAAIDQSEGPFADRIYLTWIDFAQDRYDVKVAHSDDLGLTWSPAVTVNDNLGPDDPSNPAIAVNRDGLVALIWNDRRDDPHNDCYHLYSAASIDGGETFLPNVRIAAKPTCTNAAGNWPAAISSSLRAGSDGTNPTRSINISGVPERFPNGGDTQGLLAGPNGDFHAAWINGESGVMQLWYANFTVQLGSQTTGVRRVDRTAEVGVEVSEPVIDFANKSVSFTAKLKNESSASIPGPLSLVLDQVQSGLGNLKAENPDNGESGKGATWTFLQNGRALRPGETSETRQIRWQFDGKIPSEPKNRFRGNFRVVGDAGLAQPR
jgi:hypothetical protein